jgi:hypothetical protein
MVLRAVAWHAILRAAVHDTRPKLVDALQGTFIGVLMSATLPARLGERRGPWSSPAGSAGRASTCPWCSARSSPRPCSTWSPW